MFAHCVQVLKVRKKLSGQAFQTFQSPITNCIFLQLFSLTHQPADEKSTNTEASQVTQGDHLCDHFLSGQKQRKLGWKENRETELAKVQSKTPTTSRSDDNQEDLIASLRQQLTAKTEECRHLMSRLDAIEEVNTKILRNQLPMQEDFVKVMFLQVVFLL